jgi:co-chaperonin GroES (HSP10)
MKMSVTNPEALNKAELDWAFPVVEPGAKPLGGRILVQLRRTKQKTTGAGIILIEETKETEKWNNMVAKVLMIGPLAFKNRDTMQSWPEGSWCEVGDYIRVPKWGGDRWEVKVPGENDMEDPALFMVLNDHEVIAAVTGDPLAMKAFL